MGSRSRDATSTKSKPDEPQTPVASSTAPTSISTSSSSTATTATATAPASKTVRPISRQTMSASGGSSTSSEESSPRPVSGAAARSSSRETPPVDKHAPPSDDQTQPSNSPSQSSPTNGPTTAPSSTTSSTCTFCGVSSDSNVPDELMRCRLCDSAFHARCANLPQTPEEGEFFCRWECYSAFRKSQDTAPKTPLDDFSRLSARVQSILGETARRGLLPPHPHAAGRELDSATRMRDRSKRANGRSRSSSPFQANDRPEERSVHALGRPLNGYGGDHMHPEDTRDRRPPPPNARVPVDHRGYCPHVDLPVDEMEPPPRSPRTRVPRPLARPLSEDTAYEDIDGMRSKRPKYPPHEVPMAVVPPPRVGSASRREMYGTPVRGNGSGGTFAADGPAHYRSAPGPLDAAEMDRRGRYTPRDGARHAMTGAGRTPPMEMDQPGRPSSARSRHGATPAFGDVYAGHPPEYGPPPQPAPPRSRPQSAGDHFADKRARPAPTAIPQGKYNIPWLNPATFPYGLLERFNCQPDNVNGVFRIDLTPVFGDKTMHLYQSEIDFFFRCFESADVSLVVQGMASELNQYIWAWPFILESCGSEAHFAFDHFQFRHKPGEPPELEYVGELQLSMPAYNTYLEQYLSGSLMAKEVVVLEDHVTKKSMSLVAAENIIALNGLVISEHCAQLYQDLIKSFQWDVFAGGIHCLLQYLPPAGRDKRFASPLLHFNFPGARGRLCDPGNGTTDQAYQVLVGSLELVIFERLEPKNRDAFHRVLRAAGYDADKKPMLLDSHLRVLRDAGFAWSTVLLSDGEFVHVNKGRLHFWRVVEPETTLRVTSPCVFLSWEWVYQGVSQRGISTECWFAMKNVSLCTGGWAFDPRRAIVEAAKCGVAIVRTGQFLNSLAVPSAPAVLRQLAFTCAAPMAVDREVVTQRQEQMVLFLESILPCMDAIVEEEFELGMVKDDSEDFRKIFDDEVMWKPVDPALSVRHPMQLAAADYVCGICGLELANIYKQCLGCTVHARRRRPNVTYPVFRICLRCHAQPEHHHFKPRALHGFFDKLCSSEGHTGLLPATRRYQSERSYFKCRCTPYVRCTYCGGCESCCCLCHTLFQTRFRFAAPEALDHLRADVVDVVKRHKQLVLQLQQLQQQQQAQLR